jgi:acyl carrier protein phosphodiesterase
MNFLAHAYLSFENEPILVGNMISDFVKGKKKFDFPLDIQKGIALHRMIDTYTDSHPSTKAAMRLFKPAAGAYAGPFVDVVYDHFLANDVSAFHAISDLDEFAQRSYAMLAHYSSLLPERFALLLPSMINYNWFLNYRSNNGVQNSFGSIFRRARYLEKNEQVFESFVDNYEALRNCYSEFFPALKDFALTRYNELTSAQ